MLECSCENLAFLTNISLIFENGKKIQPYSYSYNGRRIEARIRGQWNGAISNELE